MELEKPDAAEMHLAKELVQDLERTGAKRSRIEEKSAKYEQFKKQQRLYPEYAGVYADTFLANPQALHHYQVPAATAPRAPTAARRSPAPARGASAP